MIPEGTKTLAINPLNWKTDGTIAEKNQNAGACFTNYSGEIINEGYCDTAFSRPLQFASNTNFYMLLKNCGRKEISRNDERC